MSTSIEQGTAPTLTRLQRRLLGVAATLTTPLVPGDFLELVNPMWSPRELRGQITAIRPETADASTIVIRPSARWLGHWPGQYLRIGAEINGIRHWRAYTLTSDPDHPQGLLSITVKHVPEGKMSPFFTRFAEPGSIVYLGAAEGAFRLPHPLPEKLLMISAGSGISPIWSMVRNLAAQREEPSDVRHIHCCRDADDFIFGDTLRHLDARWPGYELREHHSNTQGRIIPADLDDFCPDWRERSTLLSGPADMLDSFSEHWKAEGDPEKLATERYQPVIGGDAAVDPGSGGTIRFRVTGFDAVSDGKTPILVAGEQAGAKLRYGCRMGVCHTCICRLEAGKVRDLRTGREHGEPGKMVRTCINAPEGHVELDEGHVVIAGTPTKSDA
jgi:ferredoxin-NADP reductase